MADDLNVDDLETVLNALSVYADEAGWLDEIDKILPKVEALRDSLILFDGRVTTVNVVPAWLDKKLGVWHPESVVENRVDVTSRTKVSDGPLFRGEGVGDHKTKDKQ